VSRQNDVQRILEGLHAAAEAVRPFTPGDIEFETKEVRGDPVTAADEAADLVLKRILPVGGEGWLSEESVDDLARLDCARVWVVDPIDGTREFIQGIPEWCISIGLLENGIPVAGGIYNPTADQLVLGSLEDGVTLNGEPVRVTEPLAGSGDRPISVLASVTNQELVSYSWIFPNVVTNGHWWYSNTPNYIEFDAAARLEAVPRTKQIGYYSDMYKLEFALPKFRMYKRILAKVLAERFVVDRGWSEERAVALGRRVLMQNTEKVFGYD